MDRRHWEGFQTEPENAELGHQEVLKVVELLAATCQGGILGYSKSVHHTSASVVRPISFRLLENYRQHYHGYHTKHLPC